MAAERYGGRSEGPLPPLFLDKDQIPSWDGSPFYFTEYTERLSLRFHSETGKSPEEKESNQRSLFPRFKNALRGRAWNLCYRLPTLDIEILTNEHNGKTAKHMLAYFISQVRTATMGIENVQKKKAFKKYIRGGQRRREEEIDAFITRREEAYDKLKESDPKTEISKDIQAWLLLDLANINPSQEDQVLTVAGFSYDYTKVVSGLRFSLSEVHEKEKGERGNDRSRKPFRGKSSRKPMRRGGKAYLAGEHGSGGSGGSDDDDLARVYVASEESDISFDDDDAPEDTLEATEIDDALQASEDMQEYLKTVDPSTLDATVMETLAAGCQDTCDVLYNKGGKFARGASSFKAAQQNRKDANKNRGFDFSAQGALTFRDPALQKRIDELKSRSNCKSCGQKGHWKGDPQCSKSKSSSSSSSSSASSSRSAPKGKGQSRGGRPQKRPSAVRFAQQVGLALFGIISFITPGESCFSFLPPKATAQTVNETLVAEEVTSGAQQEQSWDHGDVGWALLSRFQKKQDGLVVVIDTGSQSNLSDPKYLEAHESQVPS